jgi:hypothetical protein
MRRTLIALVLTAALSGPAAAHAAQSSVDFAVGSPSMQLAQSLATSHWGVEPCGGQVAIAWTPMAPLVNATASWTNPKTAYDNPELNGNCRIEFNSTMEFDWAKFCTVVVHELGHLAGKPHVDERSDVMSAIYFEPLPACVGPSTRTVLSEDDGAEETFEIAGDDEPEGERRKKGKRSHRGRRGKRQARKRWMRSRKGASARAARYFRAKG